ncbi:glycosyltransferase family 4 protein [Mycobacterium sp. 141]|uniref:glycosyltransferase family 4 protein n=1 Tax=Mycobacterium sp. 141 TaxID=1120797 RepID=UPI001E2F4E07|nr:glycosyltransferase family 4 protein [Mycobacterium sp. 141]
MTGPVVWVSTSMETKGGVASFVRGMSTTPLWQRWNIQHVVTHRDGSVAVKVGQFATSAVVFLGLLIRNRPAVVHLHVASNGSFYRKALLAGLASLARVPIVTHVHGAAFHDFYADSPVITRAAVRWLLGNSAVVVALGETWAHRLRAMQPSARILVVPNTARPEQPVGQPGLDESVHVLFAGRIATDKGVFDLVHAWQKVLANCTGHPTPRLSLIGDGDLGECHRLVDTLGLSGTIDVAGWVSPDAVPDLMRSAHVLVLPSYMEGQPMAILEAMAKGLCVVASNAGGIPDLVDDRCAVLMSPGDIDGLANSLVDVITDPQLRVRLGRAALDRIHREFDIDVVWRRFDDLYREITR